MSIVNRRNAVLGWAVWKVASSVAQSKAKRAVKHDDGKHGLVKRAAIVGVGFAAATGAALVFWRKKSDDTPPVL
jgi:TPP-dependent pyruvate/acetoin dehydrogenase alpha subunit